MANDNAWTGRGLQEDSVSAVCEQFQSRRSICERKEDALAILRKVRAKKAVDYWLQDYTKAGFRWSRIEAS